jgi:TolB-like protein
MARWSQLFRVASVLAATFAASPSGAQSVAGSVEAGLQTLAQNLLASAPADRRPPLSVLPFPGADQSCPVLSVFVVDELTTTFITAVQPRPRVVERQQLEAIISQNRLDEFLTDPEQRRRLGGLSGIGAVVLGTFAGIGDRLRINARMVAIDTGETIGAASVSVPRTREMEDLLRQGSGRGINCLPDVRPGAGGGAQAGAVRPAAQPVAARPGDPNCVQDGPLQACAMSLSASGTGQNDRNINVVVRITNTGQEAVAFSLIGPPPSLVGLDGSAPEFNPDAYAGTTRCDDLRVDYVDWCLRSTPRNTYTRVGAQASINVVFRFRGAMANDTSASFAAVFAGLRGGALAGAETEEAKPAEQFTYSIGLSNLRFAQPRR